MKLLNLMIFLDMVRNSTLVKKCSFYIGFFKVRLKNSALILEFVTCGVELLRGHCTDIAADQGS